MTASCVCVVYRRRRADADTHRPRRKVRDAVRRSPTQSYLVKASLQPATERRQPCPPHRHACAPDAANRHRKANRANAAQSFEGSATRRAPDDGASCAQPNCGSEPDLPGTTVVVDSPPRSTTCATQPRRRTVLVGQPDLLLRRAPTTEVHRRRAGRQPEAAMTRPTRAWSDAQRDPGRDQRRGDGACARVENQVNLAGIYQ